MQFALRAGVLFAGRYRIIEELGRGGMGCVFKVTDEVEQRTLALKHFHVTSEHAVTTLREEFMALADLRHNNVERVYDYGFGSTSALGAQEAYFTAEYIPGLDLLRATRGFDLEFVWELVAQVCRGLAYVHAHGIVHRDIKPENILAARDQDGDQVRAVLIDFGLATMQAQSKDDSLSGTAAYLAPEVIEAGHIDLRSDLYALGVSIYEVLTGQVPFRGSVRAVLKQHLEQPPPLVSRLRPELAGGGDRLVLRLLAKDPRERFSSAQEVAAAVDELCHSQSPIKLGQGLGAWRTGRLIGRERERAEARAWLTSNSPALLLLRGERGMGKSRLLLELKHHAQVAGMRTSVAQCIERATPLAPFAELLRAALLAREGSSQPISPVLRRLLGDGADGGVSPNSGHDADRMARERLRLFEDMHRILADFAARQDLLVVLFDADLGSADLRALVAYLARRSQLEAAATTRGPRIRIALSVHCNSEQDVPLEFAQLRAVGVLESMVLSPLTPAGVCALVETLLGSTDVGAAVHSLVRDQAGGNPYYVHETLRALREQGVLIEQAGGWRLDQTRAFQVPETVAELLGQRLIAVPEEALAVLQLLAVCDCPMGFTDLAAVCEYSEDQLGPVVRTLLHRGLIVAEDVVADQHRYRCAQVLVRDVVYDQLTSSGRKRLHQRVADYLCRSGRDVGDPALLARHFVESGDGPRAFQYLVEAAKAAWQLHAVRQAATHYEQALEWGKVIGIQARQHAELLERLGQVYAWAGEHGRASKVYNTIVETPELFAVLDDSWRARLHLRVGACEEAVGAHYDALETYATGVRALGVALGSSTGARLLAATASIYIKLGRYDLAISFVESGLRMAGALPTGERAALLNVAGVAMLCRGEPQAAVMHFEESLAIRRELGDAYDLLRTSNNLGAAFTELGQFGRAVSCFDQALKLAEDSADSVGAAEAAAHLGGVRLELGEIERAHRDFRRSLALAERVDDAERLVAALRRLAGLELVLGRLADAWQRLERARGLCKVRSVGIEAVRVELVVGRFLTAVGACAEAVSVLEAAAYSAEQIQATRELAEACKLCGRARVEQELFDEAEKQLQRALMLFRRAGNELEACRVTIDLVDVMTSRGDLALAQMAYAGLERDYGGVREAGVYGALLQVGGRLLSLTGDEADASRALQKLERARQYMQERRMPDMLWRTDFALALLFAAQGVNDRALGAAVRAMDGVRELWAHVPAQWRAYYLELPSRKALRGLFVALTQEVGSTDG